jgi:hypothetical protein
MQFVRCQKFPFSERERMAIERPTGLSPNGMPGLAAAALLVDPARKDTGLFELQFALVARTRGLTARGASLLLYLLAPDAHVLYLPLPMLEGWLKQEGTLSPELVSFVSGTEIYVFYDMSKDEVEALRLSVNQKVGVEILLYVRSAGDRQHLCILSSLDQAIRSGDPRALRFRALLP